MRYWAASGRPGTDTTFDAGTDESGTAARDQAAERVEVRAGRAEPRGPITAPVDRAHADEPGRLVADSTAQLDQYQYATVLERAERWFWSFCDDYLELVKSRRYGAQGEELAASANSALVASLSVLLRVFAPFLPFVTEEVWSWWHDGSVHRAQWPTAAELLAHIGGADESASPALERAALVLGEVRKTKSEAKRKLSTPVERLLVRDTGEHLAALRTAEADLVSSGFVQQLVTEGSDTFGARCCWRRSEPVATGPTCFMTRRQHVGCHRAR